jgi:hypothetical protein
MFGLGNRHDWDFSAFAVLLAQVIVLYLVTGLIYPDFVHDRQVDLRAHYFQQRRHFFGLCIILLALSICRDLVLNHALPAPLTSDSTLALSPSPSLGFSLLANGITSWRVSSSR